MRYGGPGFSIAQRRRWSEQSVVIESSQCITLGDTGNAILLASLKEAKEEGLRPSIYTHPLGTYGHSAGTTFGMWDSQEGVPVNGDYPLHLNTVYAIELNTTVFIEEWKRDIRIMLEEAGYFGPNGFRYVNKRQEQIKLVKQQLIKSAL